MSANNQDVPKPEKGQESNENWDDQPQKRADDKKDDAVITNAINDQHSYSGGSGQRNRKENVGPLDAHLEELPSEKRTPDSNKTGTGLG